MLGHQILSTKERSTISFEMKALCRSVEKLAAKRAIYLRPTGREIRQRARF